MQQRSFREKRRHPRLQKRLPLTIRDSNLEIATETTNISCLGAYCRVDSYIKPMTKLKIDLLIPYKTRQDVPEKLVKCQGVVVRTDKEADNGYNIAIYFNQISESDIQKISNYINQHLNNSILDEVV